MKQHTLFNSLFCCGIAFGLLLSCTNSPSSLRARKEALGKQIFQDTRLSEPAGQSCATCHTTARGFADRDSRAVSEGAVPGLFWDGRSPSLQNQAGEPFLNPVEMGTHLRVSARYFLLTADSIDLGLGAVVDSERENGKFRVPTLRNIALTAPYGHNGYFKTLEEIVHFYNVRDVSDEFPPAEYPATVNQDELGDLGLTPEEEADIVAFMKTLTDDFIPACK